MTGTHAIYEAVNRLVAARTGLHGPAGREERIVQAVGRAMQRGGVASPEEYLGLLERDDAALDDLVGDLTVGETYFFREPEQFAFLRREALPDLRRCRPADHVFRIWSAGCASGEEAYSLAILFEQEGLGEQAQILATDIARNALVRARQAVYNDWSLRGVDTALVQRYFVRRGRSFVLDEGIRRRVAFAYLNLACDVYPSFATDTCGLDLILCRNVLIYLDRDTSQRVAERLFRSLAPGGWLLTASSDPPLQGWVPFALVVTDTGVFYRRPEESAGAERELGAGGTGVPPVGGGRTGETPVPPSRHVPPSQQVSDDVAGRVRRLAGEDVAEAERVCAAAVAGQPLSAELRYLHAVLRMDLGRDDEALDALRKAVYLDRSLAVAHFTLGTLLGRRGDRPGARAAYRNALALCAARPADEVVPLGDGECAGRLARAAAFQLELLGGSGEAGS